jgi:RimJ/RimL family protein N-acetyltransferase
VGVKLILETERLYLREMDWTDLNFVAEMLANADVMRFYPKCYDRKESQAWVERQLQRYSEDGHGLWLAVDQPSGRPVGQVGLVTQQVGDASEPEIGYLIHRPYWRKGYATEAALGVRTHAFGPLGKRRVISLIRPENTPSQGVARKLSMVPEREVDFRGLNHIVFSVTREAAVV